MLPKVFHHSLQDLLILVKQPQRPVAGVAQQITYLPRCMAVIYDETSPVATSRWSATNCAHPALCLESGIVFDQRHTEARGDAPFVDARVVLFAIGTEIGLSLFVVSLRPSLYTFDRAFLTDVLPSIACVRVGVELDQLLFLSAVSTGLHGRALSHGGNYYMDNYYVGDL